MTKITNELLEDYAMLYPRIECVKIEESEELISPLKWAYLDCEYGNEIEYIQLRTIESITNEEFKKLRSINNNSDTKNSLIEFIKMPYMPLLGVEYKYLQSIGIATPTIDKEGNIITVDELVESGKLKLI